jgi:predicted alpha-1,6-mannanase (GH76 family)
LEIKLENLQAEKDNLENFYNDKIRLLNLNFKEKSRRLKQKSHLMENQFDVHEKWQNNAKKDIINSTKRTNRLRELIFDFKQFYDQNK